MDLHWWAVIPKPGERSQVGIELARPNTFPEGTQGVGKTVPHRERSLESVELAQ